MANSYSGGTLTNVGSHAAYMTVDGVDVGFCLPPLELTPEVETSGVQFLQDAQARAEKVKSQSFTINVTLAELSNANMILWLFGAATESGGVVSFGDYKGDSLDTKEVKIYPLHEDGHPLAGKVFTFHTCTIKPNGALTIDPTSDDFEGLPITIEVIKDTSQSAGAEFWTYGAATTTAPTVSSTSPVDGASGSAVDADITITFDMAMGIGTLTNDNILVVSTGKTSQAFTDVITISSFSLNTARTVLTIAHTADDFGASTEYQVLLTTGVCAASGVPLAVPYVFDFTTEA